MASCLSIFLSIRISPPGPRPRRRRSQVSNTNISPLESSRHLLVFLLSIIHYCQRSLRIQTHGLLPIERSIEAQVDLTLEYLTHILRTFLHRTRIEHAIEMSS